MLQARMLVTAQDFDELRELACDAVDSDEFLREERKAQDQRATRTKCLAQCACVLGNGDPAGLIHSWLSDGVQSVRAHYDGGVATGFLIADVKTKYLLGCAARHIVTLDQEDETYPLFRLRRSCRSSPTRVWSSSSCSFTCRRTRRSPS